MLERYKTELEGVQAAIAKLSSNAYSTAAISSGGGSKSYTTADLGKLHSREAWLINAIARLSGSDGMSLTYPIYCGG